MMRIFKYFILLACCCGVVYSGWTQEERDFPVTIDAYVFSISEAQIRNILKEGITRAELDTLQEDHFEAGCLLPKCKPLTLKAGENLVKISEEQIMDMQEAEDTEVICLLFDFQQEEGETAGKGEIKRHSYAVMVDKEGEQKEIGVKESIWTYPGGVPSYRFVDFRSAILFRYDRLVYDLEFSVGDRTEDFTLLFKLDD